MPECYQVLEIVSWDIYTFPKIPIVNYSDPSIVKMQTYLFSVKLKLGQFT